MHNEERNVGAVLGAMKRCYFLSGWCDTVNVDGFHRFSSINLLTQGELITRYVSPSQVDLRTSH
jgi:hypothetical protein